MHSKLNASRCVQSYHNFIWIELNQAFQSDWAPIWL